MPLARISVDLWRVCVGRVDLLDFIVSGLLDRLHLCSPGLLHLLYSTRRGLSDRLHSLCALRGHGLGCRLPRLLHGLHSLSPCGFHSRSSIFRILHGLLRLLRGVCCAGCALLCLGCRLEHVVDPVLLGIGRSAASAGEAHVHLRGRGDALGQHIAQHGAHLDLAAAGVCRYSGGDRPG